MLFSDKQTLLNEFRGKRVAIVGSGPGCLDNKPGFVDSHDIVVRVNNHKLSAETGFRTDIHYSFYGLSIRKSADELRAEGVRMCLCKCPNEKFMDSAWHKRMNKPRGVDFRFIYAERKNWWFCPTYVPPKQELMDSFKLLNSHIPTTGFSAILLIQSLAPASIYLTGFDFFKSGVHNVDERWRKMNRNDPIGHAPDLELAWLKKNADGFLLDKRLSELVR